MGFNEDMIVPLIVVALFVGLWARSSFKATRNQNEASNIMRVMVKGRYGSNRPNKPWFGTPFFFIFIILCIAAWLVFA